MKMTVTAAILCCTYSLLAAETPKLQTGQQKSLLEGLAIETSAVYKSDLSAGIWGTSVELALPLNKHVALTLDASSFEDFRGSAIDDTSPHVRANLLTSDNKRASLYGFGGGTRDWQVDDWGFGVGLGATYNLTRSFYVGVSSEIRAYIHQEKALVTKGGLGFRF